MDNVAIIKLWFDKANGNTYHSVQIQVLGKTLHSGKTYGYGNQYEETLKQMIQDFSATHYNNELGLKNLNAIILYVNTSKELNAKTNFVKVLVS